MAVQCNCNKCEKMMDGNKLTLVPAGNYWDEKLGGVRFRPPQWWCPDCLNEKEQTAVSQAKGGDIDDLPTDL